MARQVARYRDQLKTDKRRHFVRKVLFIVILAVVLIGAVIYLLFFTKLLDIRNINIQSDNKSSELKELLVTDVNRWLDGKKYFIQKRRNIFFANTTELKTLLEKQYSKIDSIEISRKPLHTLNAYVRERTPHGIWCNKEQCFYFHNNGVIYESAPQTSGFLVLKITDERKNDVSLGEVVLGSDWVKTVDDVYNKLAQKNFKIKNLVIPEGSLGDFYVMTSSNLKILFNINTNVPAQIDSMSAFIKQKFTAEKITQLEYIDLRIQDRIYYK